MVGKREMKINEVRQFGTSLWEPSYASYGSDINKFPRVRME